ncbi:MAG: hypothetical protein KF777_01565 [Planctomycetaceae bacterium]|nr:hypothetical protein [Planctomycetaceae bacterium]
MQDAAPRRSKKITIRVTEAEFHAIRKAAYRGKHQQLGALLYDWIAARLKRLANEVETP